MSFFNAEDYVPVAERITKFYEAHPQGRINTEILNFDDTTGLVVMKADVYRNFDDAAPSSTGHAFERAGQGNVNKTSHVENCETSAIGRALANLGIEIKRGIASREEMQKVERMQPANSQPRQPQAAAMNGVGKPSSPSSSDQGGSNPNVATSLACLVTAKQLGLIRAKAREMRVNVDEECQSVMNCRTDELSKKAASEFIKHLEDLQRPNDVERAPMRRAT